MAKRDDDKLHLICDVLDKLLVDRREDPMGVCDGIAVEIRENEPPRLLFIETGFPTLGRRLHPRIERIVRWLGRRFSPRRGRSYRIAFSKIESFGIELKIRADADKTPALRWEDWLLKKFIRRIPFSR